MKNRTRFQISNFKSEISNFRFVGLLIAFVCVAGCASPEARVQRIQGEKEELLATIRQQRDANRTLQNQVASLETRLGEAETQLAGGKPRSFTQHPNPSSASSSLASNRPLPTAPAEEPLNWKPHRGFSQPNGTLPTLAQLARQDDRVQVDGETGAGLWTEGVSFEPSTSALTPEGRAQLAELAKLLQRSPASKLRVLVATSAERTGSRTQPTFSKSGRNLATSRAQSVADYLDRHGIAEDRLAIASTGLRKSARDEHGRPLTSADDVRIYLVDPEQPVLGWISPETIRR
jgi:outer membrane protein OmpA-like peptidoglycan-associated protein